MNNVSWSARVALFVGLAFLLIIPAWASADVVPPFPCPEGEEWQGAHDGSCVECPEGTHWERYREGEDYGHCVEGEAPAATGCAAAGSGAGSAAMLVLGLIAFRRPR